MTATMLPVEVDAPSDRPRRIRQRRGPADLLFRGGVRGAGLLVLLIMTMVGVFLTYRAALALRVAGPDFLTTRTWEPDSGTFGIAAVLTGTVLIAAVAISVAVPLATGTALYISEFAPRRLRRTLVSLVDLMAAVPSVVYGLWGAFLLQGQVIGLSRWISTWFGWIPLFRVPGADPRDPLSPAAAYTSSTFIAGLVVGLMITPIVCSVMREVFSQAPVGEREGAYALGATRWGMIRAVVLPFGRGGMIGGSMLGLGRALGETIAVYMIISPVFAIQPHLLANGANSVSALIALRYGDASKIGISALMAAGLALFALTLVVNFVASSIIARSRSGAASDA
ncbi:phosphate ABC transporter permease subunit PstC [Micromonospora sp. SL4-19]|uniref:phosphate ABC transporter permease subunit PstC n=1 Tax=Micromonospora sp. SL4-19 TaxID=3399129 RepID=UPI003A4D9BA9